jgi:hypothetical protein
VSGDFLTNTDKNRSFFVRLLLCVEIRDLLVDFLWSSSYLFFFHSRKKCCLVFILRILEGNFLLFDATDTETGFGWPERKNLFFNFLSHMFNIRHLWLLYIFSLFHLSYSSLKFNSRFKHLWASFKLAIL